MCFSDLLSIYEKGEDGLAVIEFLFVGTLHRPFDIGLLDPFRGFPGWNNLSFTSVVVINKYVNKEKANLLFINNVFPERNLQRTVLSVL